MGIDPILDIYTAVCLPTTSFSFVCHGAADASYRCAKHDEKPNARVDHREPDAVADFYH